MPFRGWYKTTELAQRVGTRENGLGMIKRQRDVALISRDEV